MGYRCADVALFTSKWLAYVLDGDTWEPGCAFKGGSDCIEEDITVSGEPWVGPLLPPLVPISLA